MLRPSVLRILIAFLFFPLAAIQVVAAETFRIATYNVENYVAEAHGTRPAKSDDAKAEIRERILVITTKSGNLNDTQGK
jgi:hypothetical protein